MAATPSGANPGLSDHSDQSEDDILRTFIHDIRNPIGAIVGFADILQTKGNKISKDQHKQVIEALNRTAGRLSDLVDDFVKERKLRQE